MNKVRLVAGIQIEQIGHAHLILLRDAVEGVALAHGVGHGAFFGGVELFSNVAQIHHQAGRHVFLPDLDFFHEIALDGLAGVVPRLQLLQQLLQRALIFRGRHRLVIHIQHIAVGHLSDLAGELLLQRLLGLDLAAGHDVGVLGEKGGVHLVAVVAQGLAGHLRNVLGGQPHGASRVHGAEIDAVVAYGYAHGVKAQHHGDGGHRHGGA